MDSRTSMGSTPLPDDTTASPSDTAGTEATLWSIIPARGALEPNTLSNVLQLLAHAQDHDGARALNDQSLLLLRTGSESDVETYLAYAHAPARISAHDPEPRHEDEPGTHSPRPHTVIEALAGFAVVTQETADAQETSPATLELTVHPDYRSQGLGRALLETVLTTHEHIEPSSKNTPLQAWAHGDCDEARELAQTSGFIPQRHLVKMSREASKTPLPHPNTPGGIRVRSFIPEKDAEAWVQVNAEIFAEHPEQGKLTLNDLHERMHEPWFDPKDFLLAVDDAENILGFNWLKRTEEEAEIYALGVRSSAQGLGLGSILTNEGLRHLENLGEQRVSLYTEAENTPAISLYTKFGFTHISSDVLYLQEAQEASPSLLA